MTTTAIGFRARVHQVLVRDILDLLTSQPHQILISSASVAIVASEAASLVPYPANIAMAVGAEWAYLRGIASSGKGDKGWVLALNWSALFLVVLYGMLWGARKFGALSETPDPFAAWVLTAVHILPIAFLSFAAAMVHRSAAAVDEAMQQRRETETETRAQRLQDQRDAITLEGERKKQDLALWVEAQEAKAALKQRVTDLSQNTVTVDVTHPVTSRQDATERDVLRGRVVTLIRDSQIQGTAVNVSQAWKTAGLSSRGMWYKLVDEAKARGEL
jgi:hypothetical protein